MSIILLVESARSRTSFAPALERRKYEVVRARSVRQALACVREKMPALIVLDATSSRIDGARMCRAIRSRVDAIAILVLVRANAVVDPASGSDFVLREPFTPRKLLNRVARMMPSGAAAVLSIGDLSLNVANRCVRLGRKEHQLTPKQSQLLEIFMRRPDEVITREQLMQAVWNTDYMGDTRTLDVHVRWLRQIIESDAGKPRRLLTVRNVGYRFRA